MFIFRRKRLLYAYLIEWFKFADLDKINLISTGAKFFRRLLFEHSRFLPLKIFIYVLLAMFREQTRAGFFAKLSALRLFKTTERPRVRYVFDLNYD